MYTRLFWSIKERDVMYAYLSIGQEYKCDLEEATVVKVILRHIFVSVLMSGSRDTV